MVAATVGSNGLPASWAWIRACSSAALRALAEREEVRGVGE